MVATPTVRLKVPGKNRVIKVNAYDYQIHQFTKYAGWLMVGDARSIATKDQVEFERRQSEIEMIRRNSDKSPASKDPQRQFERRAIRTPISTASPAAPDTGPSPIPDTAAPPAATLPAADTVADPVVDRSGEFAQDTTDTGPEVNTDGVPLHWKAWRDETKWLAKAGIVKKVTGVKPANKDHAELLMAPYEKGDRIPGEALPADEVPGDPRAKKPAEGEA